MGEGQDKPALTACPPPPGVKITKVGGKITREASCPGGGKINCYTGLNTANEALFSK